MKKFIIFSIVGLITICMFSNVAVSAENQYLPDIVVNAYISYNKSGSIELDGPKLFELKDNILTVYRFDKVDIDGDTFLMPITDDIGNQVLLDNSEGKYLDKFEEILFSDFRICGISTNESGSRACSIGINGTNNGTRYKTFDSSSVSGYTDFGVGGEPSEITRIYLVDTLFHYIEFELVYGTPSISKYGAYNPDTCDDETRSILDSAGYSNSLSYDGYIEFTPNQKDAIVHGTSVSMPSVITTEEDITHIPVIWMHKNLTGGKRFTYDFTTSTFSLRKTDNDSHHTRHLLEFQLWNKEAYYNGRSVELLIAPYINDSGVVMMSLYDFCIYLNVYYRYRIYDDSYLLNR